MSWSKSVTVGSVSGDMAAPVSDPVGVADTATAVLTTGGGGATTADVYPSLESHPGAVWSRSGNTLTSAGRRDLPVYDNSDGFVLGTTKPTWDNTGCRFAPGDPAMTTFVGTVGNKYELVTTADNQVIERMYLPDSRIRVAHKNVVIRDCYIRIGYYSGRTYIQNNCGVVASVGGDTRNLRMEYVTVDPLNAGDGGIADGPNVSGFFFDSGTAYRCAARNITDGFMPDIHTASGLGATHSSHIWGCYASTRYLYPDPEQTDGTHNDGVQFAGGDGNTVIGCTLSNPTGGINDPGSGKQVKGQCIVVDPYHWMGNTAGNKDASQISDTTILYNWFSGAYTQVASWLPSQEGGPAAPNIWIEGNRHGGQCVWPILFTPVQDSTKTAVTGNVVSPGGLVWNNGTSPAGSAVVANVAANSSDLTGISVGSDTAYAGNDRIIEGGTVCYLVGKGKVPSTTWVKTGTWSQTSGTAVTVSNATNSGASYGYFTAPKSLTQQTLVMRFTPAGMTAYDEIAVTVPAWQTGGI